MRVLHVTRSLDPLDGGTTAAVDGLARAQARTGLSVSLLSTFTDAGAETVAPALEASGVKVRQIGPATGPLRRHDDLKPALQDLAAQADVVHLHGVWEEPQFLGSLAAKAHRKPFVLSPHGMLDAWSLAQKKLKKTIYRHWRLNGVLKRAAALHLTTEEESESVARLGFSTPRVVVPLGLDLGEFDPLPTAGRFRARHTDLEAAPLVLFLSRLHHKKGLDLLIDAFARAAAPGGPLAETGHVLVLAGPADDPAYLSELEQQIAASGVSPRIRLVGNQKGPERIEAMVDADLFVLPSHQENFGIVVVEAAAAGLPLVVSEHVNLASFVQRERLGEVVPLDVGQIAEAIARTATRPDRAGVGADARTAAFVQYGWDAIGPRWDAVYRGLLPGGAA